MSNSKGEVWKNPELAKVYLEMRRGAIPLAAEQIDVMKRMLRALDRPVRRFVDLGCGDGILAAAILDEFPDAHGLLLDFSEVMIAAARERLTNFKDQLKFEVGDFSDKNWADFATALAPFDAVVSGLSIHHQPDERKRALYREIFDLLQPGGIFVNIEHVASPTPWLESIFEDRFIDSLYEMHLGRNRDESRDRIAREFRARPDKDANILAPIDLQCGWLRDIGFQDVDCYLKIFELSVFGGRRPGS